MFPIPRTLAALCLAWLIAVTANGLAMARGQTAADGGLLVLCSGGGLVQVVLDGDGRPTGQVHVCPDLAATAIAALDLPPPVLPPRAAAGAAVLAAAAAQAPRRAGHPAFAARAPPVLLRLNQSSPVHSGDHHDFPSLGPRGLDPSSRPAGPGPRRRPHP